MTDIREMTLANGLRLITIKKDSQIMAINLGFRVGAMMDPPGKKGLTHFLEHMLFTGTTKRSHDAINEGFEFLGGDVNAFTDLSQLILSASALVEEMDGALDLLSDLILNSALTKGELERERQVILSEYKEGLEDLETIAYDRLYELGWPGEPLKYDVIGDEVSIGAITLADLTAHRDAWLVPGAACLTLASNLDHETMQSMAQKWFAAWPARPVPTVTVEDTPNRPGEWETLSDSTEMATVTMLYHFPDLPEQDETALKVLNRRLGDSDNSLLFREIRLKRGLSYDIYSSLDLTPHVGTLEIYCATEPDHVREVLALIRQIIAEVTGETTRLDIRDLALSQKMHRTHSAALLDDTPALCAYVTANALDGLDLLHYEAELARMETITLDDLVRVARRIFTEPTVSIMVPREEDPSDEDPADGVDPVAE